MTNQEVASVFLQLQLDIEDLRNQVDRIGEQVGEEAGRETGEHFGSGFGNILKNVIGINIANFLMNSVTNVFNTLLDGADELYETQITAETKLETIMKNRMGATKNEIQEIKDLASEIQGVGIVGDEALIGGLAQLSNYVTDMNSLKTAAEAMANLGVSNSGLEASDLTEVAKKFGEALGDNTLSGLKEQGIIVSEKEEAIFQSITDEAEKVAYLSEIINKNVGDANKNLAGTLAGQKQQTENTFGDIKEKVGEIKTILSNSFIDVFNEVLGWIDKILDKGVEFANAFSDFMEDIGLKKSRENTIKSETEAILAETEAVKELTEAQENLAGFDKFNTIGNSGAVGAETTMDGLTEMVTEVKNETEESLEETDNAFSRFFQNLADEVNGFTESEFFTNLKGVLSDISEEYGPKLADAGSRVGGAFEDLLDALGPVGKFIGDFLITCIDNLGQALGILGEFILDALWIITEGLGDLVEGFTGLGEYSFREITDWLTSYEFDDKEKYKLYSSEPTINTSEISPVGWSNSQKYFNDNPQNQTINLTIDIDGDTVATKVIKNINKTSKYAGASPIY